MNMTTLCCHFRTYASGICGAFTAVNMFGATKLFPYFVASLGFSGTFFMYGAVMGCEVIYGFLSIPENKGQSLVETEDKMAGGGVRGGAGGGAPAGVRVPAPRRLFGRVAPVRPRRFGRLGEGPVAAFVAAAGPDRAHDTLFHFLPSMHARTLSLLLALSMHCSTLLPRHSSFHRHCQHHSNRRALFP